MRKSLIVTIGALVFSWSLSVQALCVKSSKANLRAGPGSSHKITWVVGKHTPLIRVSRKGSWYKVRDQDKQEHWVYGSLVTSQERCLSIKSPFANLRTGPSTQSALAGFSRADRYTPFRRIKSKGPWYYVEDSAKQKFWIHESNVWLPLKVMTIDF